MHFMQWCVFCMLYAPRLCWWEPLLSLNYSIDAWVTAESGNQVARRPSWQAELPLARGWPSILLLPSKKSSAGTGSRHSDRFASASAAESHGALGGAGQQAGSVENILVETACANKPGPGLSLTISSLTLCIFVSHHGKTCCKQFDPHILEWKLGTKLASQNESHVTLLTNRTDVVPSCGYSNRYGAETGHSGCKSFPVVDFKFNASGSHALMQSYNSNDVSPDWRILICKLVMQRGPGLVWRCTWAKWDSRYSSKLLLQIWERGREFPTQDSLVAPLWPGGQLTGPAATVIASGKLGPWADKLRDAAWLLESESEFARLSPGQFEIEVQLEVGLDIQVTSKSWWPHWSSWNSVESDSELKPSQCQCSTA